jgi:hypothetical protein
MTYGDWTALGVFAIVAALCVWAFDAFDKHDGEDDE